MPSRRPRKLREANVVIINDLGRWEFCMGRGAAFIRFCISIHWVCTSDEFCSLTDFLPPDPRASDI